MKVQNNKQRGEKVMNNFGENALNMIGISKLAKKPQVLGDICGMLGDECRDLTVQLLNGEIDDNAFMSQAIDIYGQDKVNRAVFSSVMVDKSRNRKINQSRQDQTSDRSEFPNGSDTNADGLFSQEQDVPFSSADADVDAGAVVESQEPQEKECPVCIAPAVFGIGKSVCEVLADARRSSIDPSSEEYSEEEEADAYMACGNIVNAFADSKISNREMVSLLIEKYGEDTVMDALKGVNRVLEDGALLAKGKKNGKVVERSHGQIRG